MKPPLISALLALLLAGPASSATFVVNSSSDATAGDNNIGDGISAAPAAARALRSPGSI